MVGFPNVSLTLLNSRGWSRVADVLVGPWEGSLPPWTLNIFLLKVLSRGGPQVLL